MLKKLVFIFSILSLYCCDYALAKSGDNYVICTVNTNPITAYDLIEQKKIWKFIENIPLDSNKADAPQMRQVILSSLIIEQLLFEYAKNIRLNIADKHIYNEISRIEKLSSQPAGSILQKVKQHDINIDKYKQFIKSEMIKSRMLNQQNYNFSQEEFDILLQNGIWGKYNFDAKILIFAAQNNDSKSIDSLQQLRKLFNLQPIESRKSISQELHNPENSNTNSGSKTTNQSNKNNQSKRSTAKIRNHFDKAKHDKLIASKSLESNTAKLSNILTSIILDTDVGQVSTVFQENNQSKFIIVLKKDLVILDSQMQKIKQIFLHNSSLSKLYTLIQELYNNANILYFKK